MGLGFASTDLTAAAVTLITAGFAPGPIAEQAWGQTFVVRDSDGRRVEIKQG